MSNGTTNTINTFYGIVVDRHDPEKKGRVRVRCYNIHPDSIVDVPNESLPWARVAIPTTSPRTATTNIWEGTLVYGFFADGHELQDPIVTHIIPSEEGGPRTSSTAFTDPRDRNPIAHPKKTPGVAYNRSSYTPRLPGYESSDRYRDTLAQEYKEEIEDSTVRGSSGPVANTAKPEYPYNNVVESESGHLVEFDDTPGEERIHIMHKNGTSIEITKDNKFILRGFGDSEAIILGDDTRLVGAGKKLVVQDDSSEDIGGSLNITTRADVNIRAGGNVNVTASGNAKIRATKIDLN